MLGDPIIVAQHFHRCRLHPASNTEEDPDNWVSGDDPMTGQQASYLTTLAEEAGAPPPVGGPEQGGGFEADRRVAGDGRAPALGSPRRAAQALAERRGKSMS